MCYAYKVGQRYPRYFGLAILFLIEAVQLSHASDGGDKRWVHGSWVNVRLNAQIDSTVVTQISTNTPVMVRRSQDKSCEIIWGKDQSGFLPCKLIGDRPLMLGEVASETLSDGKPNSQYSPPRAFWIAPSMDALFSAGAHFQRTLLKADQLEVEEGSGGVGYVGKTPPRLVRYPVPEFNAMKALLAEGIVAGSDRDPPLLTCQQMQQAKAQQLHTDETGVTQKEGSNEWMYPNLENFPHTYPMVSDCRIPELPKLRLPPVRPSLFKDSNYRLETLALNNSVRTLES